MEKQATDFSSVLRFANAITYSNEYNLCDCLRPRAQTEGLTRLGRARRGQHLVPRATTELSRSLNKYVIEFMNRGTQQPL